MKRIIKRKYFLSDLAIWIVAFGFRLAHLLFWAKTPYFRTPFLDEFYHHEWARFIANGNLLFPTAFFRAPFYAYFLGSLYSLGSSPLTVRIVQFAIGAFGCVLIGVLARKTFGDRRIGLLAGFLSALSPMPTLAESMLLLDWLLIPLGAGVLIFALPSENRTKLLNSFLMGLFAGFFAITRPNIIAVFPIIAILHLIGLKKDRFIVRSTLIALGFFAPIVPVIIHNLSRGEPVFIASQGGLNFYLGNNEETDGATPTLPGYSGNWTILDAIKLAEKQSGRKMSISNIDGFYFKKGIGYITENPSKWVILFGKKIRLLISNAEQGNNGSPEFFKKFSPPLRSPFGWGFMLVATFLALPFISKNRKSYFLLGWVFLYGITVILFFVNGRFRLPMLVGLIPLASAGILNLFDSLKNKNFKLSSISILFCFLGFILVFTSSDERITRRGIAESWFLHGNLLLREGNPQGADSAYSKSIAEYPNIDRVYLNKGIIAYRNGDFSYAKNMFEKEIEVKGDIGSAFSNLGMLARLENDTTKALYFGEKAILEDSNNIGGLINYAQSLQEFGLCDSSITISRKGLELDSLNKRLLLSAGAGYLCIGDTNSARIFFTRATISNASEVVRLYELGFAYASEMAGSADERTLMAYSYYNLATLEIAKKRILQAKKNLTESVKLSPHFQNAWINLGYCYENLGDIDSAILAYEKALEISDKNPDLLYNLGLIKARIGRYREALLFFEQAIALKPDFKSAIEKKELLKKLARENKISLE